MSYIKTIEYQAIKKMLDILVNFVRKGDGSDRDHEVLFSQFIRDFKGFCKHVDKEQLPHEFMFYCDLFSAAFGLVTKKLAADKEMYEDLLFNDQLKFMELVLMANEEKNQGKKYVSYIEFESLLRVEGSSSRGGPTPGAAAKSSRSTAASKEESKKTLPILKEPTKPDAKAKNVKKVIVQTPEEIKRKVNMPDILCLCAAPYSLSKEIVARLRANYNLIESEQLDVSQYKKKAGKQ
jgi:hypothetical protein